MPLEFLGIVTSLPGLLLVQCVFGILLYFGLSAVSYWYFFVRRWDHYFARSGRIAPR
jgi:hypothetical protein